MRQRTFQTRGKLGNLRTQGRSVCIESLRFPGAEFEIKIVLPAPQLTGWRRLLRCPSDRVS